MRGRERSLREVEEEEASGRREKKASRGSERGKAEKAERGE